MSKWVYRIESKTPGFVIPKYLAVDYVKYDKETVFLKDTALARVEIDIDEFDNTH